MLDFSGVVFDPKLDKQLQKAFHKDMFVRTVITYLSPLNETKEQKMFHINWLTSMPEAEQKILTSDIETSVLRSFWAHDKNCPQVVDSKIANTIKLVRRFAIALEGINKSTTLPPAP